MRWLIEFTVEGEGPFPIDMLRYDSCWPEKSQDVSAIGSLAYGPAQERRQLTLCLWAERKTDGPTEARWQSFGWRVVRITPRKI